MSNIRLYIRSIHRSVVIQVKELISLKNIFQELFQITKRKEKITRTITLAREKVERRREIINTGSPGYANKVINFIR